MLAGLASFQTQADVFVILGVGNNTSINGGSIPWEDAGGVGAVFELNYRERYKNTNFNYGARWLHVSQYDKGPPFNDINESTLDHFGVYIEYKLF